MRTKSDNRIVMTLDAGGTNLVFSAMQNGVEIVAPVTLPSEVKDLERCLQVLIQGFEQVRKQLPISPSAISFAFPGPADYEKGIIGDLPNFPAFRGGVALGPFLKKYFGLPVYINNDGNLFAYGEALAGILPEINSKLEACGNSKRYRNLIGVTLGTGFGGGLIIDGKVLRGDNLIGGYLWCLPNRKYPDLIAEESVSIRGVKRIYKELSKEEEDYTPKDIYEIAEGILPGNREAARQAFAELGEVAGYAIGLAATMIDGLIVIGGGLAGAAKYILPSLMRELRGSIEKWGGVKIPRLQAVPYYLENSQELSAFLKHDVARVQVPVFNQWVDYQTDYKLGVALSHLGTNRAIALGAYWYAINQLNNL